MNSFIAWIGGKRILAKTIISMMPEHKTYYDDHPEVRKLYKRFNVKETAPVLYSMNNRQGAPARRVGELVITNF